MATDKEVEQLKQSVSIATLLERNGVGWRVDEAESTRSNIKYRRGLGEVIIVNHEGRGWWDPTSEKSGDVFTLVQHLNPRMNFGEARKLLRSLAGIAPTYPAFERKSENEKPDIPVAERWAKRPALSEGSAAWRYLTEQRGLDAETLSAASRQGAIKEGPYGSAWFAHRDQEGFVVGVEGRGPEYHGFSKGGDKTLFRFTPDPAQPSRLAVTEGAIDALSLAQLERSKNGGVFRTDTMYVATGGGIGPHSLEALRSLLILTSVLTTLPEKAARRMTIATDNDITGDRMSGRLLELAREAGVPATRLKPPAPIKDWNEQIQIAAGIIPHPDARNQKQPEQPQAADSPKAEATHLQTESKMSQTSQNSEPPHAIRADQPAQSRPDADNPTSKGMSTSSKPGADSAAKKDPMVELLEQMKRIAEQMPGEEGKKFLRDINQYLLQGQLDPAAFRANDFRTKIALVAFDFEKASGEQLNMSGALRRELTERAATNPEQANSIRLPERAGSPPQENDIPRRTYTQGPVQAPSASGQGAAQKDADTVRIVGGGARSSFMDGVAKIIDTVVHRNSDSPKPSDPASPPAQHATRDDTGSPAETRQTRPGPGDADTQAAARTPATSEPTSQDPNVARQRVEPNLSRPNPASPSGEPVTLGDVARERTPISDPSREPARVEPRLTRHDPAAPLASDSVANGEVARERSPLSDSSKERARVEPSPLERTPTDRQTWTTEPDRQNYAGKAVVEAAFGAARPTQVASREMDSPPPWPLNQGGGESLTDRIARKAREGAEERLDPEITKTQQAGRNAAAAVEELMSGPARGIQAKISAAAQTEPGGIEKVISEMRPDGKYAGLRSEFDGALQQNEAFAKSYDRAVGALQEYGKQKFGLEQRFDQFQQDKGILKEKLGGIEEGLATAAAAMPGKQPGKSMIEELGEKLNEFFKKVVDNIKQAFGFNQPANQREADNGPRAA